MFQINQIVIIDRINRPQNSPRFVFGKICYVHPAYGWCTCDFGPYRESAWNEHIFTPQTFAQRYPGEKPVHI